MQNCFAHKSMEIQIFYMHKTYIAIVIKQLAKTISGSDDRREMDHDCLYDCFVKCIIK